MAEIKSAIEIAMERTKNLVMDEKEKKEFAQKDLTDRLRAIERRFLEGIIEPEEFLAEYKNIQAEKSQKRRILVDLLVEEFNASVENERLFQLLEIMGDEAGGGLGDEARLLKSAFQKELEARLSGIKESILGRLSSMGISGSSIEPNVTEWDEWKNALQETGSVCRKRLYEWKDKVWVVSA
ncbi:MAG: hypothetical protein A4E57_03404 [Syntrophorhabdaceae bacterium PtaU1.Bin034]|nr:MAG: hypothetical protein A4E57_03404 [Syntrophorhabdaceae bacterium PtaU1.Bin034]